MWLYSAQYCLENYLGSFAISVETLMMLIHAFIQTHIQICLSADISTYPNGVHSAYETFLDNSLQYIYFEMYDVVPYVFILSPSVFLCIVKANQRMFIEFDLIMSHILLMLSLIFVSLFEFKNIFVTASTDNMRSHCRRGCHSNFNHRQSSKEMVIAHQCFFFSFAGANLAQSYTNNFSV